MAKAPLLAWFLPEAMRAWDAPVIVVRRSMKDIEVTRQRRDWPRIYGRRGV